MRTQTLPAVDLGLRPTNVIEETVRGSIARSVVEAWEGLLVNQSRTSEDEITLSTISCAASQPRAAAISAAISVERRAVYRALPAAASLAGATAGREMNRAKHCNGDRQISTPSRNISATAAQSPTVSATAFISFLSSIADHSLVSSNCVLL